MLLKFTVICFIASCINVSEAKEYARCEIAKKLASNGFPRSFLPNWVCLVEAESGRSTSKITEYPNYKSYGLFQINSKQWCRSGKRGGECNMRCEDFLKDDIKNDIDCVKIIYSKAGFDGWKRWQAKCKSQPLPDLSRCSTYR